MRDQDKERGAYDRYKVERLDGSSEPGGKHESCEYFVLDLTHDPFSKPAIEAYARACRREYPQLSQDLCEKAAARVMGVQRLKEIEAQVWQLHEEAANILASLVLVRPVEPFAMRDAFMRAIEEKLAGSCNTLHATIAEQAAEIERLEALVAAKNDRLAEADDEIERLTTRVKQLERDDRDREEREVAVLPEDVGPLDFIRTQDKKISEQAAEIERLQTVDQLWTSACSDVKAYVDEHNLGVGGERIFDLILRDAARLRRELSELESRAWSLSTFAACVDWQGGPNNVDWLRGLRTRIEAVQELARGGGSMTVDDLFLDRMLDEGDFDVERFLGEELWETHVSFEQGADVFVDGPLTLDQLRRLLIVVAKRKGAG